MEEQKKQSKFDIVGSLLSELLTEVVKYLELPDVVRSRRVLFLPHLTFIPVQYPD